MTGARTGLGSCGDCAHLILKDGPALGVGSDYGDEGSTA